MRNLALCSAMLLWLALLSGVSAATPRMVKSFAHFEMGAEKIVQIHEIQSTLFAVIYTNVYGKEIWRSDDAGQTFRLVKDLFPGAANSEVSVVGHGENQLFFLARAGYEETRHLWALSPSDAEPRLIAPELEIWSPEGCLFYQGNLYALGSELRGEDDFWRIIRVSETGGNPETVLEQCLYCSSAPVSYTYVGNTLFFLFDSVSSEGTALFRQKPTDLEPEEIMAFADLKSEEASLSFVTMSSMGLLIKRKPHGAEIWKLDPDADETTFLATVNSQLWDPHRAEVGGKLYFIAENEAGLKVLWETDGTTEGTRETLGPQPFLNQFWPQLHTPLGDCLVLTVAFPAGPSLLLIRPSSGEVREVHPDEGEPEINYPRDFLAVGTQLYFVADSAVGTSVWSLNDSGGAVVKARRVVQGGPQIGERSTDFRLLGDTGGRVAISALHYSDATPSALRAELWMSDGTVEGTERSEFRLGTESINIGEFNVLGDRTLFSLNNGYRDERWSTRGSNSSTVRVFPQDWPHGRSPELILRAGNFLLSSHEEPYLSDDQVYHFHLQSEDGSDREIPVPRAVHEYSTFTPSGKYAYKVAEVERLEESQQSRFNLFSLGLELGKLQPLLDPTLFNISPLVEYRAPFRDGLIFFPESYDRTRWVEIWRTDGTKEGTLNLAWFPKTDSTGPTIPSHFQWKGKFYFFVFHPGRPELWTTDGTVNGTRMVNQHLREISDGATWRFVGGGKELVFSTYGGSGRQFWHLPSDDALPAPLLQAGDDGTILDGSSQARDFFYFHRRVWPDEGRSYDVLLRSDGSVEGTIPLANLWRDGTADYGGQKALAVIGNRLFFKAYTPETGHELWMSDGTVAGTRMVADLTGDSGSSSPSQLTPWGNKLLFTATTLEHGQSVWIVDLTVDEYEPSNSLRLWRAQNFASEANSEMADSSADPDGDGRINLMEWIEGTSPLVPDETSLRVEQAAGIVSIEFVRRSAEASDGYECYLEWSDTMKPLTWKEFKGSPNVIQQMGDYQKLRLQLPSSESQSRFIRLRIPGSQN